MQAKPAAASFVPSQAIRILSADNHTGIEACASRRTRWISFVVVALALSLHPLLTAQDQWAVRVINGSIAFPHNAIMNTGTSCTIEAWVRVPSFANFTRFSFGRYQGSQEHKEIILVADRRLGFIYAGSPWAEQYTAPSVFPDDGLFHHIAGVRRTNGTWSLYVDGSAVLQGGPGPCWLTCNVINGATPSRIGDDSGAPTTGIDIRAARWSSVDRYSSTFTPELVWTPDSGTCMLAQLEEGTGTTVLDSGPAAQVGSFVGNCSWVQVCSVSIPPATQVYSHNGHRYFLSNDAVTYAQARQMAQVAGGYLVSINDVAENLWLTQTFPLGPTTIQWIGYTDVAAEGTWAWESGETTTFTNWGPGEPNNDPPGQHYGIMWGVVPANASGAVWDDAGEPYLPNSVYRALIEIPTAAGTITQAQLWNGHLYYQTASMTWAQAQAAAQLMSGNIVSIGSLAEQNWLVQNYGCGPYHIGFREQVSNDTWAWPTGQPITYVNWYAYEPDAATVDGAMMSGGKWSDATASTVAPAIIELGAADVPPVLNGKWYSLSLQRFQTLNAARAHAASLGGTMACITSAAENDFIKQQFVPYGIYTGTTTSTGAWFWRTPMIGLTDEITEGQWLWDSGEPYSFTQWKPGYPNNSGDTVVFDGEISAWNDFQISASSSHRCIIERWAPPDLTLSNAAIVPLGDPAVFQLAPTLGAPAQALMPYLFDISLTGASPGLPVGSQGVVPLNPPYLGILFAPFLPWMFQNFMGIMSAEGTASPVFAYPFVPGMQGVTFFAAALTFDVASPTGVGALSNGSSFIYGPPTPQLTGIAPASGTISGGTIVTLSGSRFMPGAFVSFGGTAAPTVAVINGNTIMCTTPLHIVGAVDVTVTNPGGLAPGVITGGYTFTPNGPGPAISALAPNDGPISGGPTMTVTGANFEATSVLRVNGTPITVAFVGATQMSFVLPSIATPGSASVSVINVDGQVSNSATFIYLANLSVTTVSEVIPAIGSTVTLTGTGFQNGLQLDVGGVAIAPIVASSTSASFTMPAAVACNSQIALTNPSGQVASIPFNPTPTIQFVLLNSGPAAAGGFFGISGTNFVPGTSMSIDGALVAVFLGGAGTQIGAFAPAYTGAQPLPYAAPVIVTSPSGCTVSTTYTYQ